MIGRVAVICVAVAVLAWLGVMERDLRLTFRGLDSASTGRVTAGEADLRSARFLNPDTAPDVSRALIVAATGRPRSGAAILREVLRREPANLVAWSYTLQLERPYNPTAARRAKAALRGLDPIGARQLGMR